MVARDIWEYFCSVAVTPRIERNFCSSFVINMDRYVWGNGVKFSTIGIFMIYVCVSRKCGKQLHISSVKPFPLICAEAVIGDPLRLLLPSIILQMEVDTLTQQDGREAKIVIGCYLKAIIVVETIDCGRVFICCMILDKAHEKSGESISVSSWES